MLINQSYPITAFDGKRPYDGSPMRLMCKKSEGLTLVKVAGGKLETILKLDPDEAGLHKIGHGQLNFWTGRHHGEWEVDVRGDRYASFRMKNKSQALALISWVKKYAKRKAKQTPSALTEKPTTSSNTPIALSGDDQHRAYLANLCYRLGYLKGRETVEEVDRELDLLVQELRSVLSSQTRS